jgi:hypothetical protein
VHPRILPESRDGETRVFATVLWRAHVPPRGTMTSMASAAWPDQAGPARRERRA